MRQQRKKTQHDDADFSAAVSNDTIAGSSANDAWDSVQTVSHAMQDVALKASDSPMIGSSESDKNIDGIQTAGQDFFTAFCGSRGTDIFGHLFRNHQASFSCSPSPYSTGSGNSRMDRFDLFKSRWKMPLLSIKSTFATNRQRWQCISLS